MKIMINIRKKYSKEIDTKEEIVIKNQRLRVLFNKLDETMVEENELNEKLKKSERNIKIVFGCLIAYYIFLLGIEIFGKFFLKDINYEVFVDGIILAVPLVVLFIETRTNIQQNNYLAIQQVKDNRNNLQNQIYNMAFNLYINDDLSTENRLNFEQNILNNSELKKNKE